MVKKIILSNVIENVLILLVSYIYHKRVNISGFQSVGVMIVIYGLYFWLLLYEMKQYSIYLKEMHVINAFNAISILIGLVYLMGGIALLSQGQLFFVGTVSVVVINSLRLLSVFLFKHLPAKQNFNNVSNSVTINSNNTLIILLIEFVLMIMPTDNALIIGVLVVFGLTFVLKAGVNKKISIYI